MERFDSPRKIHKILRVISSVNPHGGGPIEGIKQLYLPMREVNFELEIACCDKPNSSWLSDDGLPLIHALGPSVTSYSYTPNLLRWVRENMHRFDAVIVHGLWQYHGFAVRKALKGSDIPYFVFTHGMLDPWFRHKYPLKHLKKWLYWLLIEYHILRDAKAVIFTSEEERRLARKSFWLYRCNEEVTPYGTSKPPSNSTELSENFLSDHSELRGKRLLLFLGRLHEKKGCDILIDAFARVANNNLDLHLVMAGPDQNGLRAKLELQSARLGISNRITWVGMLKGDKKWGAYYASDVFCLPSHQENFGIVVAEALACGKPVIISDKVNIWREIEIDGAGIIHDDTLDGTFGALKKWLTLSTEVKLRMQQAAHQCFDKRFRIDKVADGLIKILSTHVNVKLKTIIQKKKY